MDLFTLYYGRSKKKMRPIMTAAKNKCENYMNARTGGNGAKGCGGFHEIRPAEAGATEWRQKSSTIGGNKCERVPRINRHGKTTVNGYIGKDGFNPHT